MARVLIVAKTHMGNNYSCVGGLILETNRSVRLLGQNGTRQPSDTLYNVGQIWELEIHNPPAITAPHVENVEVIKGQCIGQQQNLRDFLLQRVQPWRGGPEQLFENCLTFNKGSAYISELGNFGIPTVSTGYWLPDRIIEQANNDKYYITAVDSGTLKAHNMTDPIIYIPFVGFSSPIYRIPMNTLVRVSLARWFKPFGASDQRCYLQISGWYL